MVRSPLGRSVIPAAAKQLSNSAQEKAYSNGTLAEWLRYGGPGYKVYGRSKLCNLLFTRELARRLAGTGVTVNVFILGSLPPGSVTRREV